MAAMADCGGGGGRKQGQCFEGETEGAFSMLSLMALMLVNNRALFICIRAGTRCSSSHRKLSLKLKTQESHGVKSRGTGGGSLK